MESYNTSMPLVRTSWTGQSQSDCAYIPKAHTQDNNRLTLWPWQWSASEGDIDYHRVNTGISTAFVLQLWETTHKKNGHLMGATAREASRPITIQGTSTSQYNSENSPHQSSYIRVGSVGGVKPETDQWHPWPATWAIQPNILQVYQTTIHIKTWGPPCIFMITAITNARRSLDLYFLIANLLPVKTNCRHLAKLPVFSSTKCEFCTQTEHARQVTINQFQRRRGHGYYITHF